MGLVTQEDPIGIAGGLNLYGYANGDPINFSDPFGLCPEKETGRPCGILDLVSFSLEVGLVAEAQVDVGLAEAGARASIASGGASGTVGNLINGEGVGDLSLLEFGAEVGVGVGSASATAGLGCGLTIDGGCAPTGSNGVSGTPVEGLRRESVQGSNRGGRKVGIRLGLGLIAGAGINIDAVTELGGRFLNFIRGN